MVQAVIENKFDDSYVFGADDGLNLAVGIISPPFTNTPIKPIDPSYGRIRITKRQWGPNEMGLVTIADTEIETHKCSAEKLGIGDQFDTMWRVNE